MASTVPPIRGQAYTTYISLVSIADTDIFRTTVTLAAGDVVVYQDGSLDGNIDTLPVEIAATGVLNVTLSAAEMTADQIVVRFRDAVGDQWQDALLVIHTAAQNLNTIDANVDAILLDTGTTGVIVDSHTVAGLAELQAEAEDALEAYDLDHLIQVTAGAEEPTDGAYLDQIMHKSAAQTFDATTDSLEALRDTLSSSTITVVTAVSGSDISVYTHNTWEFTITGLADLSGAAVNGVFFTAKKRYSDADSAAMLQVQEGVGLLYINGTAGTAAKATLTIAGTEDAITVTVVADQTDQFAELMGLYWDIKQIITTSTDADVMATGRMNIYQGVTRDRTV